MGEKVLSKNCVTFQNHLITLMHNLALRSGVVSVFQLWTGMTQLGAEASQHQDLIASATSPHCLVTVWHGEASPPLLKTLSPIYNGAWVQALPSVLPARPLPSGCGTVVGKVLSAKATALQARSNPQAIGCLPLAKMINRCSIFSCKHYTFTVQETDHSGREMEVGRCEMIT